MLLSAYFSAAAVILLLLSQRAVAEEFRSRWILPVGTDPDFQQSFTNGDTLAVAWEGWNSSQRATIFGDAITTADLWVTSFNFGLSQFSQLLISMYETRLPLYVKTTDHV